MNFRQIRAFQTVLETGSVTRAANILHLTQPTVSKLIGAFEKQVGYRLFDRDRGRLMPTEEAIYLGREVNEALIAFDRLDYRIKEPAGAPSSVVKIASLPGAANYLIPDVLQRLGDTYEMPRVQLATLASSITMRQYIASQQYDIAIMEEPAASPDYNIILRPQPIVCVMRCDDKFSKRKIITPEDLQGERLISVGPRNLPYEALVAAFASFGVKYQPHIEIQTHLPAVGLAAKGLGYALIDSVNAWTIREFFKIDAIIVKPFEPAVFEPLAICSPSLRPLSESAQGLIALLADGLKQTAMVSETY